MDAVSCSVQLFLTVIVKVRQIFLLGRVGQLNLMNLMTQSVDFKSLIPLGCLKGLVHSMP